MQPDEPAQTFTVPSKPFRAWGPDLVVVLHPWQPSEPQTVELSKPTENDWFQHRLSAPPGSRQIASVEFLVPRDPDAPKTLRVEAGDSQVGLKRLARRGKNHDLWTSDRFFLVQGSEAPVRIRLPSPQAATDLSVLVRLWEQPH